MKINNSLKIGVLPLDICFLNPEENFSKIENALELLEHGTDLLVLPELFSTAFIADAGVALEKAEPYDNDADSTMGRMLAWARKYNVAICGSYLKLDSERRPANHCVFVEPSGEFAVYDKHHLFGISRESEFYGAGESEPPVVRYRGWNISMTVCYDLRFPAWCRNRGLRYDMLLIPANWPDSRSYAWSHLLIARAIENQAVVVGADRSGTDDYGCYDGLSEVYDFMGKPVGVLSDSGIIYATLLKDKLEQYRRRFPFYKDADNYRFE